MDELHEMYRDKAWQVIHGDMINLGKNLCKFDPSIAHATFCTMIHTYCERTGINPVTFTIGIANSISETEGK